MTRQDDPGEPDTAHIPQVEVTGGKGARHVLALRAFAAGEVILGFEGLIVDSPTRMTLQLDEDSHLDVPHHLSAEQVREDFPWQFLNHSCAANGVLRGRQLAALSPIEAGDEVTFNYNTTEYDMSTPFDCGCGAKGCGGRAVRGFKHLSCSEQEALRPFLAPHLLRFLD